MKYFVKVFIQLLIHFVYEIFVQVLTQHTLYRSPLCKAWWALGLQNEQSKMSICTFSSGIQCHIPFTSHNKYKKQITIITYIGKHGTRILKKLSHSPRIPNWLADCQEFELSLSNHKLVLMVSGTLSFSAWRSSMIQIHYEMSTALLLVSMNKSEELKCFEWILN